MTATRHHRRRTGRLRAALGYVAAVTCASALVAVSVLAPARAIASMTGTTIEAWESIPVDMSVMDTPLPQPITVLDSAGKRFASFYTEHRVPVTSLEDVSGAMVDALLSVEDRKFYEHGAADATALLRAAARNRIQGTSQGGSTLTQQYVKVMRAAAGHAAEDRRAAAAATETSLARKLIELRYAVAVEETMTKDEILLGYLNAAYFGAGAYGVGAAARVYFDTTADKLTVPQAAMLAGLLRNPSAYNPLLHPAAARDRRDTALSTMVAAGYLTPEDATRHAAKPVDAVGVALPSGCTSSKYPYYCDWVRQTLLSDEAFGATISERERNLQVGGFTVRTALDPKAMAGAQRAVDDALGRGRVSAAVALVRPGTSQVVALAQSTDYRDTQFNVPVQAQLQPGSTFKPVTYAAALTSGMSPSARFSAPSPYVPARGSSPKGGFRNVDGRSRGQIGVGEAMGASVNSWFVKVEEATGVEQVADMGFALGMRSLDPAGRTVGEGDLALTLGTVETTVLDVASTYATLAASGRQCVPTPVVSVEAADGTELPSGAEDCTQALPAGAADAVTSALRSTQVEGGTAVDITVPGQEWVGKTGTTNAHGATWFAGYSRHLAAAVWVGDMRGPSHSANGARAWGRTFDRVYGSTIAAPIWEQVMRSAHEGLPRASFPAPGPIAASGRQVPDVRGMSVGAALAALDLAGLHGVVKEVEGADVDVVSEQSPAPGTAVVGQDVELRTGAEPASDGSVQAAR